ncbi:MAG: glycoside hydrolase family 16 protein [Crocinitomicaceae bacterium]
MKYILILLVLINTAVLSQNAPDVANDPSWVLNSSMTDEFNTGSTYDPSKWAWNPGYSYIQSQYCALNDANHISIENGSYLRLSLTYDEDLYQCQYWQSGQGDTIVYSNYGTGNLWGVNQQQYGYFETRFRIPNFATPGWYTNSYKGVSANAWLWRSWDPANNIWSEIDLAEIDAYTNRHTCNIHFDPSEDVGVPGEGYYTNGAWTSYDHLTSPEDNSVVQNLDNNWHTYSVLWSPNEITIYYDGIEINHTNIGCPGMEELNWILGPGLALGQFGYNPDANTILPYHMDFDYVRTYYFSEQCDNAIINQANYNVNNYDGNHKKSITFGGSGYSTSVNVGTGIYMKATDFVQINGEFTVPSGSEYEIYIAPCFN